VLPANPLLRARLLATRRLHPLSSRLCDRRGRHMGPCTSSCAVGTEVL
jgi:hypothetical protein